MKAAQVNNSHKARGLKGQRVYNENALQRDIVDYINNKSGLNCKLSRIKNQGTWDPGLRIFRANNMEKGIADLLGAKGPHGRAVVIEVKILDCKGKLKPIRAEQVEYLASMAEKGAIVGVAYDLGDAFDIIVDDPVKYPRKDRTYGNRKLRARLAKGTPHEEKKKAHHDPLAFLHDLSESSENRDSRENGSSNT